MDAFVILGLERGLILPEGEPGDAFRKAGAHTHPDAGGGEAEFARLREAHDLLESPARRLKHWLELSGRTVELRGIVTSDLMDLFSHIGAFTNEAEEVSRKRSGAKSALALAMTEPAAQLLRDRAEELLAETHAAINAACAKFPVIERGDFSEADTCVRNLMFLEKWRRSLRALFSGLV